MASPVAKAGLLAGLAALYNQSKSPNINASQSAAYGRTIFRCDFNESKAGPTSGQFVTPFNRQGFTSLTSAPATWGVGGVSHPIKRIGMRIYSVTPRIGDTWIYSARFFINGVFYVPPSMTLTVPSYGIGQGFIDTGLLDVSTIGPPSPKASQFNIDSDWVTVDESYIVGVGPGTLLGYVEIYGE